MGLVEGLYYWNKHYEYASDDWKKGWNACKRAIINKIVLEQMSSPRHRDYIRAFVMLEEWFDENGLETEIDDRWWDESGDEGYGEEK